MPDDFDTRGIPPTLYFGYGSNLWIDQMNRRCHESRYIGIGILSNWCWIINQCGYADIIPSSGDHVYGFVYELSFRDEESLDKYEGVPHDYEKRIIRLELIMSSDEGKTVERRAIDALAYIDFNRTSRDIPKMEYIHRINMGIKDALQKGIPQSYVDRYIRLFIPPE
ncbi:hypothetical protein B0F90DRAFT_1629819 [Multifurca ochricompacta]|uniref:gamma-glutamylcyclotransferase n=1 Tax=Multifurca ochricompacta TaxID=376703 RepID=A0AAD4QN96_9AGAM|nr:hypothetical protein B0F90DRAFT_1629819 [Multifurca ochricompacta]